MIADFQHPDEVLEGAQGRVLALPVCDHYSGVLARMQKSLLLQHQWIDAHGVCAFDITLDAEDGAATGNERLHLASIIQLLKNNRHQKARVGIRIHDSHHAVFKEDVKQIASEVTDQVAFVMIPKVDTPEQLLSIVDLFEQEGAGHVPLHVLLESPLAISHAYAIAAHPRVESISFGLMDFVSSYGGAIGAWAMTAEGQIQHPLVLRAKYAIAEACHAYGKTPSHGVVTEFREPQALARVAQYAHEQAGFTRMWSIHPDQIPVIIQAFTPALNLVEKAAGILIKASQAHWAPIEFDHVLHDRASYRYYWQLLKRAYQTGVALPEPIRSWFFDGEKNV